MITFLVCDLNRNPLRRLLKVARGDFPALRILNYGDAFKRLRVPSGTLVFTDFDFLSDQELEAACIVAQAAEDAGERVKILNHPARAKERPAMLAALSKAGLNAVEVTWVDSDDVPGRYPVFIRVQSGNELPDTGLLNNEADYLAAKEALAAHRRPLRGRIAVSFEASPDEAGNFRKYGAIRIGGHVIPQHILRSSDWVVKKSDIDHDDAFAAIELDYIRRNPDHARLRTLFDAAGHQFGRADYTVRNGEIVLFEINSNPTFPGLHPRSTNERHRYLRRMIRDAFVSIDHDESGDIGFQINNALARYLTRRRWHALPRRLWRKRLKGDWHRPAVYPRE